MFLVCFGCVFDVSPMCFQCFLMCLLRVAEKYNSFLASHHIAVILKLYTCRMTMPSITSVVETQSEMLAIGWADDYSAGSVLCNTFCLLVFPSSFPSMDG